MSIEYYRDAVAGGWLKISEHGRRRMRQRKVNLALACSVILRGKICKIEDFFMVIGWRSIYVAVGTKNGQPEIVTVWRDRGAAHYQKFVKEQHEQSTFE